MLSKLNPALIAFEGTECAGKSTVISQVKHWIETEYNQEVVVVRAPGQTSAGAKIREIVVGDLHKEMSNSVAAMLFAADWRCTLEQVILPALARGAVVLSDRCNLTSWVYQHDCKEIVKLMEFNNKIKTPDLILVMTTPYEVFKERLSKRDASLNNARDYIEKETHDGMVERYMQYVDSHSKNTYGVDCLQATEQITKDIKHVIREQFGY